MRLPSPSFTYTKTLAKSPPATTRFSAVFDPLQLASWLMSIFAGLGATPSNFTVPLTVAAVAGSIGAAAGAAAGLEAAGCSSAGSFLPHPANEKIPARMNSTEFVIHVLFFMLSCTSLRV